MAQAVKSSSLNFSQKTSQKNIFLCQFFVFPDRDGCSTEVQDRYPSSGRWHAAYRHQPGPAVAGVHGQQGVNLPPD